MVPGTVAYFGFLFIVILFYYAINKVEFKQWLLLISSLFFLYFFGITSILFAVSLSLVNFFFGKYAIKGGYTFRKLAIINVINIGALISLRLTSKYHFETISFFIKDEKFEFLISTLGLGFYTMQNIAYQIDLYKKRYPAETDLLKFTLGNIFFARISSGPILNLNSFNQQLTTLPIRFTEENFTIGLQRSLIGVIKKYLIVERLAVYVDNCFDSTIHIPRGLGVVFGSVLFTIQLYFDFSGYMDIAVGSARFFGIKLSENFNMPLRSESIADWWRKWHITLMNWFTQYVYYPLVYQIRKYQKTSAIVGIAATFLISSLWHGFGFTYLIWGGLHFLYLAFSTLNKKGLQLLKSKFPPGLYSFLFIPITILMVSFANLFFRSTNMVHALRLLTILFKNKFWPSGTLQSWLGMNVIPEGSFFTLWVGVFLSLLYLIFETKLIKALSYPKFRIGWFVFLIVMLVTLGVFDSASRFIYMNF